MGIHENGVKMNLTSDKFPFILRFIYTFYLVGIDLLEHFLPDELCSVLITEALRVLWDIMGCCIVIPNSLRLLNIILQTLETF